MGGSRPAAPTTYIPTPTAPIAYQSLIPKEDFKKADQYVADLAKERAEVKTRRDQMAGSAAEIGQRMRERQAKTEAAYLSSLPQGATVAQEIAKKVLEQRKTDTKL